MTLRPCPGFARHAGNRTRISPASGSVLPFELRAYVRIRCPVSSPTVGAWALNRVSVRAAALRPARRYDLALRLTGIVPDLWQTWRESNPRLSLLESVAPPPAQALCLAG